MADSQGTAIWDGDGSEDFVNARLFRGEAKVCMHCASLVPDDPEAMAGHLEVHQAMRSWMGSVKDALLKLSMKFPGKKP